MYVIYGEEEYLISRNIKKIIKQYPGAIITKLEQNSTLSDLIFELDNEPLFGDQKIVVVNNFDFNIASYKSKNEQLIKTAISSIKQKTNNIFIFKFNESKLDNKNPLIEALLSVSSIIKCDFLDDVKLTKWVKKYVIAMGGNITNQNILLILDNVPHEMTVLANELNKLLHINKTIEIDVDRDFGAYRSNNPYIIQNLLERKDIDGLYKECAKYSLESTEVYSLFLNFYGFFTLPSQIYLYKQAGYNDLEIHEMTKIHAFRIKKAIQTVHSYGIKNINKILKVLSEIDSSMKKYPISYDKYIDYFLVQLGHILEL